MAHGSVSARELAELCLRPEEVLDFSVNTHPLGPEPGVLRAVQQADWTRYPGDDEQPLRQGLADLTGVSPTTVVLGNGSVDLMWLLFLAVRRDAGTTAAVLGRTFGEYERAARATGCAVAAWREGEPPPPTADVLVVCQPNNPTGDYHPQGQIAALLREQPARLLVLDEAYVDFVDARERWWSESLLDNGNLVILRSMTKNHGLPGVRLGYALAAPPVAAAIEAVRPPWNVNAGALRAGLAALEPTAQEHVARGREIARESAAFLTRELSALGLGVHTSSANFLLVHVGDGHGFRAQLVRRGIVVRDCASFGLPDYVRIACRTRAECEKLVATIAHLDDQALVWAAAPSSA